MGKGKARQSKRQPRTYNHGGQAARVRSHQEDQATHGRGLEEGQETRGQTSSGRPSSRGQAPLRQPSSRGQTFRKAKRPVATIIWKAKQLGAGVKDMCNIEARDKVEVVQIMGKRREGQGS